MWPCPKCGEKIPDGIATCWLCGTDADGTEDPEFVAEELAPERASPIARAASRDLPPLAIGDARVRWIELFVVLTIVVLPDLWLSVHSLVWGTGSEPTQRLAAELTIVVRSVTVSALVLYLICRSGDPWRSYGIGRPRWSDLGIGTLLGAVLLGITTAALTLAWAVFPEASWDVDVADHAVMTAPEGRAEWTVLVVANLANGFAEELTMRAYVLLRLRQLWSSTAGALLVSSALFASYHLYQGPVGVVSALLFGVLFGIAFLLYRRLWPIALAHAAVDIFLLSA